MLNLGDHAANRRGILQLGNPADLVELEADQRLALRVLAADRAAGLLDLDHLCGLGHRHYSEKRETAPVVLFSNQLGVATDTARLQRGHLDVAARRNRARRILMLQRVEGGANHVVRVRRTDRLRHHILDAERLEHRAHRTAGDDAGTGRRRTQIDAAGAVTAEDVVMQRTAFAQSHARQVALRRIRRLADRLGNFARLAVAETDPALLVADHDQRGKTEALTALDDFRHAIDVDELVDELAVALLALPAPFAS